MATETQIANLAAARVGSETAITSLQQDRPAPRAFKAVWDIERRACLREASFNFSTRRFGLPRLKLDDDDVIYPYTAAFGLPPGFLRLIEVLDSVARLDYQMEGNRILANVAAPLYVRCVVDVPELANWDDAAAEAFALRLAWRCGRKLSGSTFDQEACWNEYQHAVMPAKHVDAQENPPIEQEESDWVLSRGIYGWR